MGVRQLLGERPELILSGINSGSNVADDITYSGTIAGAMEGTLLGIPSIALSQAYGYAAAERVVPWEDGGEAWPGHHPQAHGLRLPGGHPSTTSTSRTALPAMSARSWSPPRASSSMAACRRAARWPQPAVFLGHVRRDKSQPYVPGSDDEAVERGLISVTPLRLDMTAHDLTAPLRAHMGGQD